jgi:23S rRNA pseudouridine2604 synthase
MENSGKRINKYLSEIGYCSRREADRLIESKRVKVNGATPEVGTKIHPGDVVSVDGKNVGQKDEDQVYIMLNKPRGIVCTTDQKREKNNIVDFVNHPQRIFPIGRLDKPSEGLILLTSDGDIVNKILRARNNHEKEYVVDVNKAITKGFLRKMASGVPILDTVTRPCVIEQLGPKRFRIILTQGLNRQIRRMCEYLDYRVTRLQRVRIMNILLDVPLGKWRDLTKKELEELMELTKDSQKTFTP